MEPALPGLSRISPSFAIGVAGTDRVWTSRLASARAVDVHRLRTQARAVIGRQWNIDADIADAAELVVGELAGNAQRHGAAPIEVSVRSDDSGEVLVSVRDAGRGMPRLRPIDEEAECGRGLHLVAAVSRWWRVDWQPDGGKIVIALLATADGESG